MKIAIHHFKDSFSERWIKYCKENKVDYKIVDCFSNSILDDMQDCDALFWHWHHADHKARLLAQQLTIVLESIGKKVFPDFKTCWHFDDKVGQKYLLESIGAPYIPTYVFYDKSEALKWADDTIWPKVFKLRGGAGAANVKLIKNKSEASRIISKAFGKGFSSVNRTADFKDRIKTFIRKKDFKSLGIAIKGLGRLFVPTDFEKRNGRESGYVYFQEFIEDNSYDIRVIVIGEKAFAIKRNVRENDFRASGSGKIDYDKDLIDIRCVQIAFETSKKLDAQCLAYDFVFSNGIPLIVEISYGFAMKAYDYCPGYWSSNLHWHECKFSPQEFMITDVLRRHKTNN